MEEISRMVEKEEVTQDVFHFRYRYYDLGVEYLLKRGISRIISSPVSSLFRNELRVCEKTEKGRGRMLRKGAFIDTNTTKRILRSRVLLLSTSVDFRVKRPGILRDFIFLTRTAGSEEAGVY